MLKNFTQTIFSVTAFALTFSVIPGNVLAVTFKLEDATITDINQAFDDGSLTSTQLTQLYLNRINAYDKQGPNINSIITINPKALETAAAFNPRYWRSHCPECD
jgi:amidase